MDGVTTSTGFNFYDLRGPSNLLYPVNVPFRNMLSRKGNPQLSSLASILESAGLRLAVEVRAPKLA